MCLLIDDAVISDVANDDDVLESNDLTSVKTSCNEI